MMLITNTSQHALCNGVASRFQMTRNASNVCRPWCCFTSMKARVRPANVAAPTWRPLCNLVGKSVLRLEYRHPYTAHTHIGQEPSGPELRVSLGFGFRGHGIYDIAQRAKPSLLLPIIP